MICALIKKWIEDAVAFIGVFFFIVCYVMAGDDDNGQAAQDDSEGKELDKIRKAGL